MSGLAGAEALRFDGGTVGALVRPDLIGTPRGLRPWGEHLAAAG